MKLSEKEMSAFRTSAEKQWHDEQQQLSRRYERSWIFAHKASEMLKKEFGATRVAVFGSLIHKELFHQIRMLIWLCGEFKKRNISGQFQSFSIRIRKLLPIL
jgi:inorganic triphosphatase YgiF